MLFCTAAAALAALVILVRHAGAYFFPFDDFALLHQATTSAVAQLVGADVFGFYRPLVYLLLKLEFKAFGWQHPWGYAAAASAWHCANALLVGGVVRRLGSPRSTSRPTTASRLPRTETAIEPSSAAGRFVERRRGRILRLGTFAKRRL